MEEPETGRKTPFQVVASVREYVKYITEVHTKKTYPVEEVADILAMYANEMARTTWVLDELEDALTRSTNRLMAISDMYPETRQYMKEQIEQNQEALDIIRRDIDVRRDLK